MSNIFTQKRVIADPPIAKFLFSDTRMAIVWLVVRLYVGYAWIEAGLHKVQDPAWMDSGAALKGYLLNAAKLPVGAARPNITFDWYRSFLQFLIDQQAYTWFGKVIALGEAAVGIALILGAFVGIAAVAGAFMNMNYLLAGTASTNPVLLVLAILLILAWKTAGFIGLDKILLPIIGTPWRSRHDKAAPQLSPAPLVAPV